MAREIRLCLKSRKRPQFPLPARVLCGKPNIQANISLILTVTYLLPLDRVWRYVSFGSSFTFGAFTLKGYYDLPFGQYKYSNPAKWGVSS
jgi:hypothetical protein